MVFFQYFAIDYGLGNYKEQLMYLDFSFTLWLNLEMIGIGHLITCLQVIDSGCGQRCELKDRSQRAVGLQPEAC